MKGATAIDQSVEYCEKISIHAPVKGATLLYCMLRFSPYFNPRTREGCDT